MCSHPIIQPGGWLVSAERQEPQFFISILTDVEGEARFISQTKIFKKTYFFILGKRLYCPCLSFSEAVTKESLGLSREADEGEEEVCRIILHINVFSPDCEEFCLCRTPLLVLSPWLSALPPCPGMLCQGSHCPPRRSPGSCLRLSALPLCPGKDVAYKWRSLPSTQ